jgi:glutathione peroxidase
VAGFYSNDFGDQGGSDEQIAGVIEQHGVEHDQFALAPVLGENTRPLFRWIAGHDNPGPRDDGIAPVWNFYKFLISREGVLVAAFDNGSYPGRKPEKPRWAESDLVQAIEQQLGA